MYHSTAGGTGSGLGGLLTQKLCELYPKKNRDTLTIFSSPNQSTSVIEPYNTANSLDWMLNYSDVNIVLDNQALNRICQEKLEIPDANYSDLNELIAHYFSSITSSMRFGGTINQSLNSIHGDMIPYPRVHFLMGTIASITTAEKAPFLTSKGPLYR